MKLSNKIITFSVSSAVIIYLLASCDGLADYIGMARNQAPIEPAEFAQIRREKQARNTVIMLEGLKEQSSLVKAYSHGCFHSKKITRKMNNIIYRANYIQKVLSCTPSNLKCANVPAYTSIRQETATLLTHFKGWSRNSTVFALTSSRRANRSCDRRALQSFYTAQNRLTEFQLAFNHLLKHPQGRVISKTMSKPTTGLSTALQNRANKLSFNGI